MFETCSAARMCERGHPDMQNTPPHTHLKSVYLSLTFFFSSGEHEVSFLQLIDPLLEGMEKL